MLVVDLMTQNVAFVRPNQSLSDAARLMWECDCGALPVLNEAGEVCGMLTDRDICMATWLQNSSPAARRVSSVMSHHLYSCAPFETVSSVERVMRANQIRRVPVLSPQGQLLGIISIADIVKKTCQGAGPGLVPDELVATLVHICRTPPAVSAQA